MLFDDDRMDEAIRKFETDKSWQGGPGGWRASGHGVREIMRMIASQLESMDVELRYSTEVISIRQPDGNGWDIASSPVEKPAASVTEHFDKLAVCTGTFSTPDVPHFSAPFLQPWGQPIAEEAAANRFAIHTSHLSIPSVQTALYARKRAIVVIGCSKSSLDAAERLAAVSARYTQYKSAIHAYCVLQFGHNVKMVFRNGALWGDMGRSVDNH